MSRAVVAMYDIMLNVSLLCIFIIDLGDILEAPETAVVPLGSNATFSCTAEGYVF